MKTKHELKTENSNSVVFQVLSFSVDIYTVFLNHHLSVTCGVELSDILLFYEKKTNAHSLHK